MGVSRSPTTYRKAKIRIWPYAHYPWLSIVFFKQYAGAEQGFATRCVSAVDANMHAKLHSSSRRISAQGQNTRLLEQRLLGQKELVVQVLPLVAVQSCQRSAFALQRCTACNV